MKYSGKRMYRILFITLCMGGALWVPQRTWPAGESAGNENTVQATPAPSGEKIGILLKNDERTKTEAQGKLVEAERPRAEGVSSSSAASGVTPIKGETATEKKEVTVPQAGEAGKETDAALKTVLKIEKTKEDLFSMELRNVEIQDFLRVLAYKYKLNIVIEKGVKGAVTASFSNISLEEALNAILESLNLTSEKQGTIIKVTPHLVIKTFVLQHVEAKNIYESMTAASDKQKKNTLADLLSEDGKVLLGALPNSLLVVDYPSNIQKVEDYITMADRSMTTKIFKLKYLNAQEIGTATETKVTTVLQESKEQQELVKPK